MTTAAQILDENAAAAHGLAISAAGAALARLLTIAGREGDYSGHSDMHRMAEQAEKAATCLAIAGKAEADGDDELAAVSWTHALKAIDRLSRVAGEDSSAMPVTMERGMVTSAVS